MNNVLSICGSSTVKLAMNDYVMVIARAIMYFYTSYVGIAISATFLIWVASETIYAILTKKHLYTVPLRGLAVFSLFKAIISAFAFLYIASNTPDLGHGGLTAEGYRCMLFLPALAACDGLSLVILRACSKYLVISVDESDQVNRMRRRTLIFSLCTYSLVLITLSILFVLDYFGLLFGATLFFVSIPIDLFITALILQCTDSKEYKGRLRRHRTSDGQLLSA